MNAAELVRHHFDLIDRGEMVAMADLFEPNAVYLRPGYRQLVGRNEILYFYTSIRPIRDGRHSLGEVLESGVNLAVRGVFVGRRLGGEPIVLRFSDFFELGSSRRFARRQTYFALPLPTGDHNGS